MTDLDPVGLEAAAKAIHGALGNEQWPNVEGHREHWESLARAGVAPYLSVQEQPPGGRIEAAARLVMRHAEYDDLEGHWRFEGKLLADPDGAAEERLWQLSEALSAVQEQPDEREADDLSDFSEGALIALIDLVMPLEDLPQSDRFLRMAEGALEAKRLGGAVGPASTDEPTGESGDDSSQGLPDTASAGKSGAPGATDVSFAMARDGRVRELEDALREVACIHHRSHRGVAPSFRNCSVLTCQNVCAVLSAAAVRDTEQQQETTNPAGAPKLTDTKPDVEPVPKAPTAWTDDSAETLDAAAEQREEPDERWEAYDREKHGNLRGCVFNCFGPRVPTGELIEAVWDTEQQEQEAEPSDAEIVNAIAGRLSLANAPEHLERAVTELLDLSSLIESREATNTPSGEREQEARTDTNRIEFLAALALFAQSNGDRTLTKLRWTDNEEADYFIADVREILDEPSDYSAALTALRAALPAPSGEQEVRAMPGLSSANQGSTSMGNRPSGEREPAEGPRLVLSTGETYPLSDKQVRNVARVLGVRDCGYDTKPEPPRCPGDGR